MDVGFRRGDERLISSRSLGPLRGAGDIGSLVAEEPD